MSLSKHLSDINKFSNLIDGARGNWGRCGRGLKCCKAASFYRTIYDSSRSNRIMKKNYVAVSVNIIGGAFDVGGLLLSILRQQQVP